MKLIRVTAVDYTIDDDELLVQLTGRDSSENRVTRLVRGCIPYFYVRYVDDEIIPDHKDVRDIHYGYESYDGVSLVRIDVRYPSNAGDNGENENLTEYFDQTWEADIPFYRRCSIDYGLSGHILVPEKDVCHISEIDTNYQINAGETIDPRIFIADIEVLPDADTKFEDLQETYEYPVTHIGVWDSQADEYIVLHLDPGEDVDVGKVSEYLESHVSDGALVDEWSGMDIHLREYQTEENLLRGFIRLVKSRRPDIVSGWNFDSFDWDYLLNRYEKFDRLNQHELSDIGYVNGYQIERAVDCLPAFDMMDAYKKMTVPVDGKKRSYSLDYIAKEELGVGKLPDMSVRWGFENDKELLLAYNIIDVMLCVALERRQSMHDFFLAVTELSQVQIYDGFSEMRLIDGYIMSRSDRDEVLPSIEDKEIPDNAGSLVLNPSDGVNDWVGVIDLKSLYPSAIITWNISPETIHWYEDESPTEPYIDIPWVPDADNAEGGDFTHEDIDFDVMWADLSQEGLIPKYIKQLFPERAERKSKRDQFDVDSDPYETWDRKQAAVKVIMNAFYGVMSLDYWRLAEYGLGDAVTSASRYVLWMGKEICERQDLDVIYGDTDSVLVQLAEEDESKEDALERGQEIEHVINEEISECVYRSGLDGDHPLLDGSLHGTIEHTLSYEFEKLYRRFFQAGDKKRYAGTIVWKEGKDKDEEVDMTGFESQRSDSPELTEEVQSEVIRRILSGESFDEVSEYIQDLIDSIETMDIESYKIALPKSINKSLDEYGNIPAIRACRFSNDVLDKDWSQGDDPWMYHIRETPPMTPGTDVIALDWGEEIPEGYEIDVEKVIERALENPLKSVLQEVGWQFSEVRRGVQTSSAADASWGSETYDEETQEVDQNEWGW